MYHSGIGGGGFMIARSSNGSYEVIDFRETAPAAAFQDMYKNNTNASIFGGLARCVIRPVIVPHTNILVQWSSRRGTRPGTFASELWQATMEASHARGNQDSKGWLERN